MCGFDLNVFWGFERTPLYCLQYCTIVSKMIFFPSVHVNYECNILLTVVRANLSSDTEILHPE